MANEFFILQIYDDNVIDVQDVYTSQDDSITLQTIYEVTIIIASNN